MFHSLRRAGAIWLCVGALAMGALPAHAGNSWTLSQNGYGPARIGMTAARVSKALDVVFKLDIDPEYPNCTLVGLPGQDGAYMMFVDGRLASIGVEAPSTIVTSRGIGIGTSEAEVANKYPHLDSAPQVYSGLPSLTLIWWERRDVKGIRFDTDDNRHVNTILAGNSSITASEGCL